MQCKCQSQLLHAGDMPILIHFYGEWMCVLGMKTIWLVLGKHHGLGLNNVTYVSR